MEASLIPPLFNTATKERETLSELSAKYEVSPVMISRWKKEFIDNSAAAFETSKRDDKGLITGTRSGA